MGKGIGSTNGFANEFQSYVGKPAGTQHEVGLGKKVVLALTEKIQHKQNHVFIDNYFNSAELIEKLLEINLFGCGTVRSNVKDLPQQMKPAVQKQKADKKNQPSQPPLKLQRGQCKQWQKGKFLAAIWQEKRGETL